MAESQGDTEGRTFSVRSASDLLGKLHHEANYVWGGGVPADVRLRTYAILNCALTAWQIKDWVFAELRETNQLSALERLAGRSIVTAAEFGTWLCEQNRYLAMCYQIATATKHVTVSRKARPQVRTFSATRSSEVQPSGSWTELVVQAGDEQIVAEDLMVYLYATWITIFRDLDLLDTGDPLRRPSAP